MTRDEAIQKVTTALCKPSEPYWCPPGVALQDAASDLARRATEAVDIAVALGLKLDEPRVTAESDALEWLARAIRQHTAIVALTPEEARPILRQLESAGFRLIRSD